MAREWSAPESAKLGDIIAGARATAAGAARGQVKTDDHSNATTAIPKLLKTLEGKGCQKKIARPIVKQGADYVLASRETGRGCGTT